MIELRICFASTDTKVRLGDEVVSYLSELTHEDYEAGLEALAKLNIPAMTIGITGVCDTEDEARSLREAAEQVASNDSQVLDLRLQYNNDLSPEVAKSHPVNVYRSLNEYLLSKIGKYLAKLMFDPVQIDLGKDDK